MSFSNGGISQLASIAMMPMQSVATGVCSLFAFDPLFGFNDPVNSSAHTFKVEEIQHGRTPTISRIVVTYRNLGVVTVSFIISGTNDSTGEDFTATLTATIGTTVPTNRLRTTLFDASNAKSTLPITGQNLQLTVRREANAGPLSITKITLCGRVERQELA
jgi:hypothetical protein